MKHIFSDSGKFVYCFGKLKKIFPVFKASFIIMEGGVQVLNYFITRGGVKYLGKSDYVLLERFLKHYCQNNYFMLYPVPWSECKL